MKLEGSTVKYSLPEIGGNQVHSIPLYSDQLSGSRYFFAKLPIAYLFHDDKITPRSAGGSLSGWWKSFSRGVPSSISLWPGPRLQSTQVLVEFRFSMVSTKRQRKSCLASVSCPSEFFSIQTLTYCLLQHKCGHNPPSGRVRQIGSAAPRKRSVQDRIERYRKRRGLTSEDEKFPEKDLVNHLKGEWREMRRYVLDAVRDTITHHSENKLKEFIDFGGRGKERPFSYSTVEKTLYSFFLYSDLLDVPLNYHADEGESPRELEEEQILRLMNLIAARLYLGRFDQQIGIARVENRIQKGEDSPENHLTAHRMAVEEILYGWLRFVDQIVQNYFITTGNVSEGENLSVSISRALVGEHRNLLGESPPVAFVVNRDLSATVFGGKQKL